MSEAASIGPSGSAAQSGLQLAQARQSCNLSVADVAHQLKLSPAQVEAMEAGEYQRLPGAVFVRGFLRNYARLVKLDPEPLVAQVEQRPPAPPPAAPEAASPADIPFPSGREFRWHKYAIGALLVVAVLVAFEFYGSWTDPASEVPVKSRPVAPPHSAGDAAAATDLVVTPTGATLELPAFERRGDGELSFDVIDGRLVIAAPNGVRVIAKDGTVSDLVAHR